jgi:hypothetical protein
MASSPCIPDPLPPPNHTQPAGWCCHLVSDLDGTWLPAPDRRGDLAELEAFLGRHPGIVLTFATGRTLASALDALAATGTVWPVHLVTDVGTAIWERDPAGSWVELQAYARWVEQRWRPRLMTEALRAGLPPGVAMQVGVAPRRRLALEVARESDLEPAALGLGQVLADAGVKADILPSSGRCLDVLPPGVHKGTAIEFLETFRALPRPRVVCGDSENDLGMLRRADVAVVMASGPLARRGPRLCLRGEFRPEGPGPLGILEALLALSGSGSRA